MFDIMFFTVNIRIHEFGLNVTPYCPNDNGININTLDISIYKRDLLQRFRDHRP